jgi:hypothetical protein
VLELGPAGSAGVVRDAFLSRRDQVIVAWQFIARYSGK